MNSKTQSVKRFFDNTEVYLRKDFGVSIRAIVVRSLLGEVSCSAIVDLGCGDGRVSLQYLSNSNRLTLVDLSERMLERARLNTSGALKRNVEYINRDFLNLTWKDSFDVVLCVGVLAHVVSVEHAVAQVATFLRPGGRCILQVTDNERLIAKIDCLYQSKQVRAQSYGYSINSPTLAQIVSLAKSNGLKLRDGRRYSLLLPGMGKLPNRWLYKYQLQTLNNRFLSRYGSEVILLFSKDRVASLAAAELVNRG